MSSLLATERYDNQQKIRASLELLVAHLKGENLVGHFDINSMSEDFFCVLLNLVYDLELVNLNKTEKINIKAIDLGDDKSKVAIQVTSENSKAKIKSTLSKFEEDDRQITYDRLRLLILDRTRPAKIEDIKPNKNYTFDPKKDVLSIKEFCLDIDNLKSGETVSEIYNYLKNEVPLLAMLTDENVDQELVDLVSDLVEKNANGTNTRRALDFVEVNKKIELNFHEEADRDFVRSEYSRCITRFAPIEEVLRTQGSDSENILQSSMADLYNRLRSKKTNNREILEDMIVRIEESCPNTLKQATRRLAIKSLVMFHFDDCTIFEKTETEKTEVLTRGQR